MSERQGTRNNVERAVYALLMLLCIYLPLLPFGLATGSAVLPDFAFLMTAAWVLRRPESAPLILVAAFALLADFLLFHAVGLSALLLVLGSEFLRTQTDRLRDEMFLFEWLTVVAVLAVITILELLVLSITLAPLPEVELLAAKLFVTAAAYPCIAAFLHWVVRLRAARNDRLARFGRLG